MPLIQVLIALVVIGVILLLISIYISTQVNGERVKDPIISNIIDNLRRVFQVLDEQSKKVERETGLTSPQFWTLKIINESSPVNFSDLANKLYLHYTTVIGIIDHLEKQDLVKRQSSKDDYRVFLIELTAKGNDLVKSTPEVVQGLLVSGLEKIAASNLMEIYRSMNHLVKIFGVEKTPPKLILSPENNFPIPPWIIAASSMKLFRCVKGSSMTRT
jgi:DNA-binding MarR family transcriptional regulator